MNTEHWAKKYIGIPYQQGELDCWGLLKLIQKERYGRTIKGNIINHSENWMPVDYPLEDGDVVYMHPGHVGTFIKDGECKGILHTDAKQGRSTYTPLEYMSSYGYIITGFYRWAGK